ncbi:MAG: hypothetical protein HC836_10680 [Richelia sp. RM2_1_2]|nr:hypothetical protein [Richelia sp. RM2_1_2]
MAAIIVAYETDKWQITSGGRLLDTAATWTKAVDVARSWLGKVDTNISTDCDVIELHKKNGTVQVFGAPRKPKTTVTKMVATPTLEGPATYTVRLQKGFDADPHFSVTATSLDEAIKCLPRSARNLNWSSAASQGYDSHTITNGVVASIERCES